MTKRTPIDVFVSYSHKDERLRAALQKHLTSLEREGLIATWYDFKIVPGEEWEAKIFLYLNKAKIILLLVSADFIASDFCYDKEMRRAIERHEARSAIVVPVILRPVDWSGTPFAKIQALPRHSKPVTKWTNKDAAFLDVVNGIRSLIIKSYQPPTTPKKTQKISSKLIEKSSGSKSEGQWVLVISATIKDVDKQVAEAIVDHLRKLSKDTRLTLKRIDSGSVRLVLEGSIQGLTKIKELVERKQLHIEGFRVEKVDIEDLNTLILYLTARYLEEKRPSEITISDIEITLKILAETRLRKSAHEESLMRAQTLCYSLLHEGRKTRPQGPYYFEQLSTLVKLLQFLSEQ